MILAFSAFTVSFLAATKQLYDWFSLSVCPSVCLSVCPSVCHTFLTMFPSSYHHEIFRSNYHSQKWCPCKRSRSKVKVTEVNTQLSRFRTPTPVWIHIGRWNHAHSWKQHRRGALLFLAATKQLYEWYFLSVCPSVCPSVRLSHLFDYVPIIVSSWNFQELSHWTRVRSMQKVKFRGQRSRSQRSRPKFSFPDCNSSMNSHMMIKLYI